MSRKPFTFSIPVQQFDLELLPSNARSIGSEIQLLTSPVECSFTEVRSLIQV